MNVEIVDISHDNFGSVLDWSGQAQGDDVGCKFCLYWEQPDRAQWPDSLAEREAVKREWFGRVWAEFGSCGKLALVGSRPVGYSQFSPPAYLPNVAEYECGPPISDGVFIACLYVREQRGKGVGSALLRAVLGDLHARGIDTVETFARSSSADSPSGPLRFWPKNGFSVVRRDDDFALVRRNVGSAAEGRATGPRWPRLRDSARIVIGARGTMPPRGASSN